MVVLVVSQQDKVSEKLVESGDNLGHGPEIEVISFWCGFFFTLLKKNSLYPHEVLHLSEIKLNGL